MARDLTMRADTRIISRMFFRLLPAQILLVAVGSINTLIDGAVAANYIGPLAMAVIGLYNPTLRLIETLNGVLLGGSQILCGRFLGKNLIGRTRSIFSLDMVLVLILSGLMMLAGLLAPRGIAALLGANAETLQGLGDYIFGMAFGYIPQFMTAQLTSFLQIEQQQKRTYAAVATMALVNIFLDFLLVVHLNMGLLGLGLATALSYWAVFLVQLSFYLFKKASITLQLRSIDWKDIPEVVRLGLPGAVVVFCLAIRGIVINQLLLTHAGTDGVSALSAMETLGGFLFAITSGMGTATRLLVSIYVGEEDRTSLLLIMRVALSRGLIMVSALAAAVAACAPLISGIFYAPGTHTFDLTCQLFRIYPLSMPLSNITIIMINYYQSSERMKIVHVLSVMDGLVGTALSALILGPVLGATGIWIAYVLNGVYTVLICWFFAWRSVGHMPRSLLDFIALPGDFGIPADRRLDLTIHSMEEVTETSRLIMEFCDRQGVDPRRSYYAGLCMEEMAANIVKHGFSDGRSHTADIRVVRREDGLRLRIKDDCRAFNPREKAELLDPADITHNIGLRTVNRLAKSMTYTNTMGLNVLTIGL